MADSQERTLGHRPIEASAPCRVDMGGTLDLSTLYYPLAHLEPCTFNLALDLRTRVRLLPHRAGRVRVSSLGFESEDYPAGKAPFDGPLGLMFAIAAHFGAAKLHIEITSASPPPQFAGRLVGGGGGPGGRAVPMARAERRPSAVPDPDRAVCACD